jgi:hypothetical protein
VKLTTGEAGEIVIDDQMILVLYCDNEFPAILVEQIDRVLVDLQAIRMGLFS